MKTCCDCEKTLSKELFQLRWNNIRKKYYHVSYCTPCNKIRKATEYKKHKDAYLTQASEWRKNNKDKRKEIVAKWSHDNLAAGAAKAAKYRASKLKATPVWADHDAMFTAYKLAKVLEQCRFTQQKFEVDHYIPLQGKNVCGLHCEQNLRVIPLEENRRKSNLHD